MKFVSRFLSLAAILTFVTTALFAQVSGTLAGVVTQEGAPLPGVTVTISSPQMQGTRSSVTNESGGYTFGALPPGDYTVRFELQGLAAQTQRIHVGVAQNARADAAMRLEAVAEAITVTAAAPAVAETTEVQSNFRNDVVEELPITRTLTGVTGLAPGVQAGVNGLTISGGQSFDNLYTVNGAVVQENLRGQPHNLFIEDAIQETTVQQAGISAEFGNFTGGVVNAITKSGGNEFSGSFRDSLTNPSWTQESPNIFTTQNGVVVSSPVADNPDALNHQYEATLGGRIIRDRLWFFLAGRHEEQETFGTFAQSTINYPILVTDKRLEGKLTGSITPRHNLVVSYLEAPVEQTNNCQGGCYDISSINPGRELPNDFLTAFYNGVITNNFLVEARYSQKNFAFVGSGGRDQTLVGGTPIRLFFPPLDAFVNEPLFCGSCGDEERNNDQWALKATYFLGTRALGSHNLVAGVDRWTETRLSNNHQSPTDFIMISITRGPTRDANGNTLVNLIGGSDWMQQWPILQSSLGSDLRTDALYVNDKWDLNSRWQFNLGARYDMNDALDSAGNTVAKDSMISPRLGVTFDPFANGRVRFNGSYGVYVGRLAETISGSASSAGNPARFDYLYGGPDILNASPEDAMRRAIEWYESQGGITKAQLVGQNIPGFSTRIPNGLDSPNVQEWSVGISTQIGNGFVRADYITRDWRDFYASTTNRETGVVTNQIGQRADLTLVGNSDDFVREYDAIQLQAEYRLWNRVNLGGNYTWSELIGNVIGETTGSGPVVVGGSQYVYPEYNNFAANNPIGRLTGDQTHKARAWASIDVPTFLGNFNFSVLERFDSGSPYSLAATIDVRSSANYYGTGQAGGITNPGYVTPPTSVTYFFSDRGELEFDDLTATDLAINYNTNPGWLRGASIFAQGEVINLFNEHAQISGNTQVLTHLTGAGLQRFNPLRGDQPVEGTHYRRGQLFGLPTSAAHYQTQRTYRVSLGLRF
jgi:hypothetical protein